MTPPDTELSLGACTYTYLYSTNLSTAIDEVARLGFKMCELMITPPHSSPDELDPAGRRRIYQQLRDRELTLCAIQPGYLDLNIASMIPRLRRQSIAYLRDFIDMAADLGARFFVLGPGRRHPLIPAPFGPLYSEVRDIVADLAAHARERGVVTLLENMPSGFIETGEQLRTLCDDVGNEACRILYDVANGEMVEDPAEGLSAVAPYLEYVHLSDTSPSSWRHATVGTGTVDFAAVSATLRSIGFDGPTVLEVLDPADPGQALKTSAERLGPMGWSR